MANGNQDVLVGDTAGIAAPPTGRSARAVGRSLRSSRWLAPVLVVVMLAGATAYHTYPALTHCSTRVMGPPGDNTAGGVWTAWVMPQEGGNPVRSHTDLTAASQGEAFWQVEWYSQSLLLLPMWALSPVVNEVCAYNVVVIGGMFFSGIAMALLAYWISRSWSVAGLCGYAYAFSPFAQIKAGGHASYVNQWIFPLQMLAALWFLGRPSWRRGLVVGVSLGIAAYIDGYFLLFSAVNAIVLGVVTLVLAYVRRRRTGAPVVRSHLGGLAVAAVAMVLILLPIALTYATQQATGTATTRSSGELEAYAAEPLDYLLPNRFQPLFNNWFGALQDRHLGLSNYSESTLSLRWSVLAFAVYGVVLVVARTKRGHPPLPRRWRLAAVLLVPVTLAALVASGPPHLTLLGISIPNVSEVVTSVASAWRVYARFFIDAHAALLGVAAIGMAALFWRFRSRATRIGLALLLLGVLTFEGLMGHPFEWAWFDYSAAPQGYKWIATQSNVDVVADWPVWPTDLQPDGAFATYQPVHGKAVINPKRLPANPATIADNVMGLSDPQTAALLRREGVDLVIVHRGLANWPLPSVAPPGYPLERAYTFADEQGVLSADQLRRVVGLQAWYDMEIYRVPDGAPAAAVVLPSTGFAPASPAGWNTVSQTVAATAQLDVVTFDQPVGAGKLGFDIAAGWGRPQVEIRQGDRLLWSQRIALGGSHAELDVDAAAGPITIRTTPIDPDDSGIVQLSQIRSDWAAPTP